MLQIDIIALSIALQFLAALLALSLIRITRKRAAWLLIAAALALMTVRRITTLARLDPHSIPSWGVDPFDALGLIVSALMVAVFLYIRKYFFDVFTTERTLRESEQRYRELAQNIPDAAVFLFDRSRRIVMADGPLLARGIFGVRASGWLGSGEITIGTDWAMLFSSLRLSALGGKEAHTRYEYKGRTYCFRAVPLLDAGGLVSGGMAIAVDITSELLAEKDRAEALSFLQHTVDGVAEPIMVIDPEYTVSLMNQVVREKFAGTARPGEAKCYAVSHHRTSPCDGESHPCPLKEVQRTLLPVTVLHQHRTAEGELRRVEIMASPLLGNGGKFIGVIEATRDITDREKAAETVRELSQALEQSPAAVVIADTNGVIEYVNSKFMRLTGYSLEEARALGPWTLGTAPSSPQECASLKNTLFDGEIWKGEFLNRRKTGEKYWESTSISPLRDAGGVITHFVAIKEDISERKRAEEEARHHTKELEDLAKLSASMRVAATSAELYPVLLQRLASLFGADGAAIAIRDRASDGYVGACGYLKWEHWTGRLLPADLEVPRRGIAAREDGSPGLAPQTAEPELFAGLKEVASVPLAAHGDTIGAIWLGGAEPIKEPELRLLGAIADMAANAIQRQTLFEDLQTQLEALKAAQARLVQTEKLAALGQLISGVAHELNNPLTSVVLYSELLQHEELSKQARANLDKVVSEALRSGKIVKALLDFARQHPLARTIVQVNDVIEDCVDLVAYELRAHMVRLELDLGRGLPTVSADVHQLQQVLVNLINNAREAMDHFHGHGLLKIVTESGFSEYASALETERHVVRIRITDDGPGIHPAELPRVFDPFYTTKGDSGGTGLGLSICHGIISEHGGHIWAESQVGQGATFVIELPIAIRPARGDAGQRDSAGLAGAKDKSRILIMDDEPNILDVLSQSLRRRGYVVDTADSGAAGLFLLSQADYDHILCDVRMPEFSGFDFYRQTKAHDPCMAEKIVFITGDTVSTGTRRFIEENGVRHLAKPFELADVLRIIGAPVSETCE